MEKSGIRYFHLLSLLLLPLLVEAQPYHKVQNTTSPSSSPPCNCTVTQGSFSFPLPFMGGSVSASTFYAYGNPIGASANTGLEMSETMLLMLYEDITTGNTSLVLILDAPNDGSGGGATIAFDCLPGSAFVEFSDDAGELAGAPPLITGNFTWADCCTDGGIIGGVGCGSTFTINPNISSGINAFSLVYGTPINPVFVNMPDLNCPITINCGGTSCCSGAFEFSGAASSASCGNTADGEVNLTTSCAASPTFSWSNGATTEDVTGLLPGTYNVTITDANGCTQGTSYFVSTANPDPTPTISGPTEFCDGETVELTVDGSYSTYNWSNGLTGSSITVNSPGTYSVTVSNAAGCTGTTSTILVEHPLPSPNITGPTEICFFNDTIALDAGAGFSSYQWSSIEITQAIEVTLFGTYFVTVTNSFGCTGTDFTIVTALPNPVPIIIGPTTLCSGIPGALDAGPGFANYHWSTGANTEAINISMAGTYIVTVSGFNGCTGSASQDVALVQGDTVQLFQTSCNPLDTGLFAQLLTNQLGCDSFVLTMVSYSTSDSVFLNSQSCDPQDVGVFVQTFNNQYGCDSVVIETVTLLPSNSISVQDFSCDPQDVGIFVQTFNNQYGCDSVVTTTVSLLSSDTVYLSETSCNPADAGVSQHLYINSAGCDSLVVMTTTYALVDTTYLQAYSCNPSQVGQNQQQYTGQSGCDSLVITVTSLLASDTTYLSAISCDPSQAGQSQQLLANQAGCDSLVITNTLFVDADTTLLSATTCDPLSAGIVVSAFINSGGCDSIVITTTSLLPLDTVYLTQTSCDPSQSGTQTIYLTNQYGCDSLVFVTTNYALADSTFLDFTTCDPTLAGIDIAILQSSDGCDSVVTTTTTLLASDTVYLNATSCNPVDVGTVQNLFSNQFGCDSLVILTTTLVPSDTILVSAETCNPAQAGTVSTHFQNSFGCDSMVITTTVLLPSNTTTLQVNSCDPAQVGTTQAFLTNLYGCDSIVITTTSLLPSDTTWLFFTSCFPQDTGLIVNNLTNQYGCDSLVFEQTDLLPPSACGLEVVVLGDTIGCHETTGALTFTIFNGDAPYNYTWTDQSGNTGSGILNQAGQPQQVIGLPSGNYEFVFTDNNGLMGNLSATVYQPLPLQISIQVNSDYNGSAVSCFGENDGSALVNVLGGGVPPYSFNWSNGNQSAQSTGLGSGLATVTVTSGLGCTATASVFLDSPDSLQFSLSVSDPNCFSLGLGAIQIEQVAGGVQPYRYRVNGGGWQDATLFDGLPSGNYLLEVEDANGCLASAYAFINSFTQLSVVLGPDVELEYGDSALLEPLTNLPFSLLDSIYWGGVVCPDCPSTFVAPIATSTFSVTVVDSLGCTASDDLTVVVKKNFHVYVPNVFSPNDDGINDKFTLYCGPQVNKIQELKIFDRWGEPVFTYYNLPPNDFNYGWDGTYRGKLMDTAVFVYYTIVEYLDGSTALLKGDVLLLR